MSPRLHARDLAVAYGPREVLHGVDLDIPDKQLTAIIGPNACGKSTLLRALARLLPASRGEVWVDDRQAGSYTAKEFARVIGMLPQTVSAPDGMSVADLVSRGRYPHQSLLRQWSADDQAAVSQAMAAVDIAALADRPVNELSGGQRQRAWLAMVLAQQTPIVLLDEPTTYLDLAHQIEVLNLTRRLREDGHTVVVVLHELNLAFRYADHLVVMSEGRVVASGTPHEVVDSALIEDVYDVPCLVIPDPVTGTPMVIPKGTS